MIRRLVLFSAIVVLSVALSACTIARKTPQPNSTVIINGPTPVDLSTENGSYPDNLLSCPASYLETDNVGKYLADCVQTPRGDYCSFSRSLDSGNVTAILFNSTCLLCQTHHQKNAQFTNYENITYQHLGFIKGSCPKL